MSEERESEEREVVWCLGRQLNILISSAFRDRLAPRVRVRDQRGIGEKPAPAKGW
jgi:hypothetical protein